ncbi:NCS2 family permease [Fontivita pretiosa]|uniref:NCS2 family permease n=1 Tax=Fontivita pretiosa TaxID=2989684 RepID=UPI003D17A461
MWRLSARIGTYFQLQQRGSSVAQELRGAIATFLTMSYIVLVNPQILGAAAGMSDDVRHSLAACTALAAGVCSILMGLVANFPIALASGMGLNAIVAYQLSAAAGSWRGAMGLIVLDGLITAILVLAGLREAIMHAIPRPLRLAIGAGIGIFIAFIGLTNARIVLASAAAGVPMAPGHWRDPNTAVSLIGLLITAVLMARRVRGALILGILITTLIGLPFGVTRLPSEFRAPSFVAAFQADVLGAMQWKLLPLLFAVIMVDFFDTLGTASAVAEEAGLVDQQGRIPRVRRVLLIDSLSAAIGGMLGASSVTSYIESAAGVAEGARTGLHSVFVGVMFLLAIVLAPLAGIVPAAATAPALILVGYLMMSQVTRIDYTDAGSAIPAFITLLTIPLTYSIAHGIGYGFLTFVAIRLLTGRGRQVHPLMYLTSLAFAAYFLLDRS